VRIEGSQEGVASAKAELLELVDKMVSCVAAAVGVVIFIVVSLS